MTRVMQQNRGVWSSWWQCKLKNNGLLIHNTKLGNFEEVAKLIDTNFCSDLAASINFQEPVTG